MPKMKQVPMILSMAATRHHNPMQFLLPPRARKNWIIQGRKMPIPTLPVAPQIAHQLPRRHPKKLHRDYRKVRKELGEMTANHLAMMTTNVRLVKQITEKDEMNVKSLSTILYSEVPRKY